MSKILFICIANSCRSQMAEGWARHYGMDQIEVFSAGVKPFPLDRVAVQVMGERGVDIAMQVHKGLDVIPLEEMSMIVTLCSRAMMKLPSMPPHVHRLHWDILDPTSVRGSPAMVLQAYRRVRDDLESKIKTLLPLLTRLPAVAVPHGARREAIVHRP